MLQSFDAKLDAGWLHQMTYLGTLKQSIPITKRHHVNHQKYFPAHSTPDEIIECITKSGQKLFDIFTCTVMLQNVKVNAQVYSY